MRRLAWRAGIGAVLLACGAALAAPATLHVIYPRIEERSADDYGYRVLRLALDKAGRPYRLEQSAYPMNQQRARQMLEQGAISIFETGTSAAFEARFDAVYFPVDRGLSGFRLLLVHKDNARAFAQVRTREALARWTAGQGPGWADSPILQAAGIQVHTAEFDSLPLLLNAKRIDFCPLGIEEIAGVLARNKGRAPAIVIEPHLVLHYDFARLFFVRKGDRVLRETVLRGLTRAFADGSLQHLLASDAGFARSLAEAGIRRRTLIELRNPNLTPAFHRIPRKYFYTPD